MKLIFIGPQGSGKGTQAKIIANKLNLEHISTGDLLRSTSDFKKEIEKYQNQGQLVPNKLIIKILKNKLNKKECKKGFILDGFPRNLEQAQALNQITNIDKVIEIHISDKEAIKRISGRFNCSSCGAIYNINTSPKPKIPNTCNSCNIKLIQRSDDNPEAIKKRLEVYHKETQPLLKFYPNSTKIKGEQEIDEVTEDILKTLSVQ